MLPSHAIFYIFPKRVFKDVHPGFIWRINRDFTISVKFAQFFAATNYKILLLFDKVD